MDRTVADPGTGPYEEEFTARQAAQAGEPEPLRELRAEALARFRAEGFPTTRLEAWKKTSLQRVANTRHRLVEPPGADALARAQRIVDALRIPSEAARFVLVDGHHAPSLSTRDAVEGLTMRPLAAELRSGATQTGDLLPLEGPEWAVADLNTALFADGLHLTVQEGKTIPGVVHLVHISTEAAHPVLVAPRHRIELAPRSRMTLAESHAGLAGESVFTTLVAEADVQQGAHLRRVKMQREPLSATHVALFSARVGRDAALEDVSFSLGAGLSRHDIHAALSGPGAHATLNGVFLGRKEQHVDHHTTIEHVVEDGTSRQVYKGIVDDSAHAVFTGKIIVRPGAQRTDADQQNKNLILSRKALVDTTPQLEIHADDVKCAHGSAIGRLDEAQLFYLRTRGIPDADARLLLTEAFAREPLVVVGEDDLRGRLEGLVTDWFIAGHPDADPAAAHAPARSDPLRVPTAVGPIGATRKTA